MQASAVLRRLLLVGVCVQAPSALAENEPLHSLIDKLLVPAAGVTPATATDGEFLRRVSLDLAGMPPTADEARAFIADTAPGKRDRLIDRLFASPHYVRHFASALDLMLMERRPNTNVSADDWQAWLVNPGIYSPAKSFRPMAPTPQRGRPHVLLWTGPPIPTC
jgi:hypothetical protein